MDTHQQSVQKVNSVVNSSPTISRKNFPITHQTLECNHSDWNIHICLMKLKLNTHLVYGYKQTICTQS